MFRQIKIEFQTKPKTMLQYCAKWAAIAFGVNAAIQVSSYVFNLSNSITLSMLFGLIGIAAIVYMLVMAVRERRDTHQNGFITYGEVFITAVTFGVFYGIFISVWSLLFQTIIAPGYTDQVLSSTENMLEDMGLSQEKIEETIKSTKERLEPSAKNTLFNFFMSFAISAFIGLIAGAIMNVKKPENQVDILDNQA